MENYNNPNGQQPYYTPPVRHPGSGFATAALILGLLSIMTAIMGTVYPPLLCGGLAIILAILSKGKDRAMLTNAKVGMTTGIVGLIVNVAVVVSTLLLFFNNPQFQEEVHTQLNQYYEALYGESFDDAWSEIQDALENSY